ncbi:hypothetical protein ACWDA7_48335 [Streptomyces sp. NPDC001156]
MLDYSMPARPGEAPPPVDEQQIALGLEATRRQKAILLPEPF